MKKKMTSEQIQHFSLKYDDELYEWFSNGNDEKSFLDHKIKKIEDEILKLNTLNTQDYIKEIEKFDNLFKEPLPEMNTEKGKFLFNMRASLKNYTSKEVYRIEERARFLKRKREKIFPFLEFELSQYKIKKARFNNKAVEVDTGTPFTHDFTASELTELIAGIYATGRIKNTNKEKFAKRVFNFFDREFKVNSFNSLINQFKNRNQGNSTKFINSVSEALKHNLSK